jgi:hypothetical protein
MPLASPTLPEPTSSPPSVEKISFPSVANNRTRTTAPPASTPFANV